MNDKDYENRLIGYSQSKLLGLATKLFNTYIRERDKDLSCISCGQMHTNRWEAGHYFNAGKVKCLRFNEYNVNKQCHRCNYHMSGNESGYRMGLVKKYGDKVVEEMEFKAAWEKSSPGLKHIDRWTLIEVIIKYRGIK